MVAVGLNEWPRHEMKDSSANLGGAVASVTLDSTTDCLYWVGKSPITDSLSVVYFRTGNIVAAGGDTVDVRIETVANGRRTGTLWGTNTNVTVVIADSDDSVWKTATLTAAASLTEGDEFAIVIASSAGTPAITLSIAPNGVSAGGYGQYPIIVNNLTGSDAVVIDTIPEWIVAFTTAGIKSMIGLSPIDGSLTLTAFNNASATHEEALRFKSTVPRRAVGMRLFLGNIAAGANFTASLWDATGATDAAALAQVSVDGDFPSATTVDGYVDLFFDTKVTIDKDTVYYLGVRPDTANSITIYKATTAGTGQPAGSIKAFSHESTDLYLATRTWSAGTASAWTTTTTTYPFISLLYDQLDDGAGAGASLPIGPSRIVRA